MNPYLEKVNSELRAMGLVAELRSECYDPEMFGNAICDFRCGTLLLRFVRDRSQEWLEVASESMPQRFFLFEDIEVAMGWRTLNELVASEDMKPLADVVRLLKEHLEDLTSALQNDPGGIERANALKNELLYAGRGFRPN